MLLRCNLTVSSCLKTRFLCSTNHLSKIFPDTLVLFAFKLCCYQVSNISCLNSSIFMSPELFSGGTCWTAILEPFTPEFFQSLKFMILMAVQVLTDLYKHVILHVSIKV